MTTNQNDTNLLIDEQLDAVAGAYELKNVQVVSYLTDPVFPTCQLITKPGQGTGLNPRRIIDPIYVVWPDYLPRR